VPTPGRNFREELRAIYGQDWYEVGIATTGTLLKAWEAK
jgi:hypothetical protein